ncbi:NBS-LRR type disease resistance protein [Quillaja saponaria]|uniref:NBS-LRR type disease resistance protein n=1 Tax=Quillaja saponaria TaxID=32244 RepID=A0AAD7QIR5_QUISA|nr:NBS-LRR type disease resistance protein [Quillaja saponaria]
MAESILFGVVERIIGRLGSLVAQHIGIVWNVKDELERIQNSVSAIKAVVMDAEEQGATNHAVKHWLQKLKDAVDDADDLLDDLSTEALSRELTKGNQKSNKVCNFFFNCNPVVNDFKLGYKIKKIRKRLDAIAEDRMKFNFSECTTATRVQNRERQQTHSFVREEEVIGREKEKAALIELLADNTVEDNVQVIPIVGIGGLGKTTLVQLVYNDGFIQNHFDLKMWVYVSEDDCNLKGIVGKIVGSTNSQVEQLQLDLRKIIKGKRYLLVLDDVWDENREQWLKLKSLLLDGAKGSKVIVTSRSEKVAKMTATFSPFYLQGLDEKKSWVLFTHLAFENGEEPKNKDDIVAIGKEIVKKCSGVPLAIRSVGSLLYFKSSEIEWLYFKENDLSKINPEDNSIFPILKLSYDHLPLDVKNCFAYFSLFPKDYTIKRETMIQLWMAQGFIQSLDENKCLEDVGDEYFMNLYWRSFFQDVERDIYGDISSCKMHDLIHDLAQFVAGKECTIVDVKGKNINKRTRHVSVGFQLQCVPTWLVKANKLKTFILPVQQPDPNRIQLDMAVYDSLISSFNYLRTLDLHALDIAALPNSVCLLKHLRYLDLSDNKRIEMLPNLITSLHNLQTLKLSGCRNLKELPTDIRKLVSLRHLELDDCKKLTHMPKEMGQLTSLRTLTSIIVGVKKASYSSSRLSGGISELSELNNLSGSLEIRGLHHLRCDIEEVKAAKLQDKRFLKSLTLDWDDYKNDDEADSTIAEDELLLGDLQPCPKIKSLEVICFRGVRFSDWLSSLSNLVKIRISFCYNLQHLPPLHQLPQLELLDLSFVPSLEYIDSNGSEAEWCFVNSLFSELFFPSLKSLQLLFMENLRGWWRCNEVTSAADDQKNHNMLLPSFPCLSRLHIGTCHNLTVLPQYPYVEHFSCHDVGEKMLRQLLKPNATTTTTSGGSHAHTTLQSSSSSLSHHSPLYRLRSLSISQINDLEYFPDELLPNLTSLLELRFSRCSRLKSLSRIIPHLSALHLLEASWCDELDLSNNEEDGDYGMQWQELSSLHTLHLDALPKLVSLPEGLRHVTTLQHLKIKHCSNLESFPEWIGGLQSSLVEIDIDGCHSLTSLPEGMHNLKCLQRLKITRCPHLEERCKREEGEDWPKIAHVPEIIIGW